MSSVLDLPVCIPSYRRAGRVSSEGLMRSFGFHRTVIYARESERDEYAEHHANVASVPDGVRGIGDTRQFIVEQMADEPAYVMIDDDISGFSYKPDLTAQGGVMRAEPEQVLQVLGELYDSGCIGAVVDYWSIADPYDGGPWRHWGFLCSNCYLLRSSLIGSARFDRLQLYEDMDFSLQLLQAGVPVRISSQLCIEASPGGRGADNGGCDELREAEQAALEAGVSHQRIYWQRLQRLHPEFVQIQNNPGTRIYRVGVLWEEAYAAGRS